MSKVFLNLRNALNVLRCTPTLRNRLRLFTAAQGALKFLKQADAGFVHGDFQGLAAELATALRTLRRGLPCENAKRHSGGLKTARAGGPKHLGVKGAGCGHGAKRATLKAKGKAQPEGAV